MNVALLNDYEIDIEILGLELEKLGFERKSAIKQLNERYRGFSKKGDFRCVCCDERVKMVLAEDKAFHFRHFDKESCAYSENYKRYRSQKENLENSPKHRAGKAIIQTYLEGVCKTNDIKLSAGYRFKSTLSFVPDFILEFSNGQRWAIDYITGLKNDQKYARGLIKRREAYLQNHFTPIFLFDSYWLAYEPEINYVSLVDGELLCISQTHQDHLWTDFIRGLEPNLKNTLFNNRSFHPQVKSMTYVAPHEREIHIIRFLQETTNLKKTRTVYKPIKIPFHQALKINNEQTEFTYSNENEEEYREELKKQLSFIYQEQVNFQKQQEIERARKEEEVRKQAVFGKSWDNVQTHTTKSTNEYSYEDTEGIPFTGRSQRQMDVDLKREMDFLQRKNPSEKPYWYRQMVQHMTKVYGEEE